MAEGLDEATASHLASTVPEACLRQLEYLDYQDEESDRAATLQASIESDWPQPTRHYWLQAAQQQQQEGPEPEPISDVQSLVDALQAIAEMRHTHDGTPCPGCTAWDALKAWSHRQSNA